MPAEVTLHPGDAAVINGARLTADRTVTLRCDQPVQRVPCLGIHDLPETTHRIDAIWKRQGHRVPMITRRDLRCPCGSAYVRRSETHHSCQYCGRVWPNEEVLP